MANGSTVPSVDSIESYNNVAGWQQAIMQTPSYRGDSMGILGHIGMMASDLKPFTSIVGLIVGGMQGLANLFPAVEGATVAGTMAADSLAADFIPFDPADGLAGAGSGGAGSYGAQATYQATGAGFSSLLPNAVDTLKTAAGVASAARGLVSAVTGATLEKPATGAAKLNTDTAAGLGTVQIVPAAKDDGAPWFWPAALALAGFAAVTHYGKA
jgi:hypothetical protein